MSQKSSSTPNTHLGEVSWFRDIFFGTYLYLCQDELGMHEKPPVPDHGFLDPARHSVEELWECFGEHESSDGKLNLIVYNDDCHSMPYAFIETTLLYGEPIDDQVFLNLVADFVEHVKHLPLAECGEDAGTPEEFNEFHESSRGVHKMLDEIFDEDDIPF